VKAYVFSVAQILLALGRQYHHVRRSRACLRVPLQMVVRSEADNVLQAPLREPLQLRLGKGREPIKGIGAVANA